jgi:hypothetical protein
VVVQPTRRRALGHQVGVEPLDEAARRRLELGNVGGREGDRPGFAVVLALAEGPDAECESRESPRRRAHGLGAEDLLKDRSSRARAKRGGPLGS